MDDFNEGMILPTLIKQLRSILERYPDDGQILKEVIQNAEDAGARKVVFLIDNTTYGTDPTKLYHENLIQYQGPALYAYNDAVFSNDDWKGVRMLHDSVKADDPMKVGRFGLGFKSVFHMTDLPSVFSGKGIGFIDPHREIFEIRLPGVRTREKTTSYLWHLERDREEIARLEHQFEPFLQPLFGVNRSTLQSGFFGGTIFRFPLRLRTMKSSDLSKTTYDQEKVKDLVNSLRSDAHHMLLFLRNLESIEVYEKNSDQQPEKLLDIRITRAYRDLVVRQCQEFQEEININWRRQRAVSRTYPMEISVEALSSGFLVTETFLWLVSQYYAGMEESCHVALSNERGYLPLVGVALPLEMHETTAPWKAEPKGHVFCFLPLPLEKKSPTGLRFNVHGSFAIDQNRRHIKWPSADLDMVRSRDDALLWNQFLVNVVLPKAVIDAIIYLTQKQKIPQKLADVLEKKSHGNPEFIANLVYSMFPDDSVVTTQWSGLSRAFYNTVWDHSFFYSLVSGGIWLNYENAIFDSAVEEGPLRRLRGSFFYEDKQKLHRSILYDDKQHLVCVPQYILKHLPNRARKLSAEIICKSFRNVQYKMNLKDKDRKMLLKYFSEELINDLQVLVGLQLLPLADGSWTVFQRADSVEKVYIGSNDHPQELLPGLEHKFLKMEAAPKCATSWAANGTFQLKYLSPQDISVQIRSLFTQYMAQDTIQIKEAPWLTNKWLAGLWSYLQKNFRQSLHSFQYIHILPLGDGSVSKLSQDLPILSKVDGYNRGSQSLHADLIALCLQVGVKVIEKMEQEVFNHPGVWNTYVLQPNVPGILLALYRREIQIGNQALACMFETVPERSVVRFKEFVANGIQTGTLTANQEMMNLLKSMPIFSTVNGSGKNKSVRVPLEKVKLVAPRDNDLPLSSPKVLLDLSDENSRRIAGFLNVRPSTVAEHLTSVYFPAVSSGYYTADEISLIMRYVCKNLTKLEQSSCELAAGASKICFILKRSGDLVRPNDVYDKTDLLCKLFGDEDVFPCGEFAKVEYSAALLRLGLKTSDAVTAREILTVAEQLSECGKPSSVNWKQSEALMEFLNRYGDGLLQQKIRQRGAHVTLISKLSELSWVKISTSRPQNYPPALAFVGENSANSFVRPSEIVAYKHVYLVGSSRATIETQGIASLAKNFGWNKEPSFDIVAEQLLNIIQCYEPKQKVEVQYLLKQVYGYLNQDPFLIRYAFVDVPWIWQGDGFAKVNQMVLSNRQTLDMRPYVYTLPVEVAVFRNLWNNLNIEEKCNPIKVLHAIKKAHDDDSDIKDKERDLQLAVNILNEIAKNRIDEDLRQQIVIPISTDDDKLELKGIDECTYCDKEWYHHGFNVEDLDEDIYLIDELVPLTTAERLSIPSLINKTLGAEGLAIGYGQSEPLTTRLKTILRDYTDGMAVLKELIQNADDAGATEIRFLYDERKNEDAQSILLDPGMKGLQGPALWVYNNAVFTDDDLESIVKLSGATKETMTEKIGRFGLGFNAVYNLTDVPIFISREFIIVFDPHTTYLGRTIADNRKPGIKLNLRQNRKKIQRLVDQFKPMNGIFDCELGNESKMDSYNGTLFRFPLRTQDQAIKSDICKICYDREEILQLLKLLHESGQRLLLYTQNVEKLTVYHLPENASPPGIQEWYSVKKNLVKVVRSVGCLQPKVPTLKGQCAVLKSATAILTEYRNSSAKKIVPLESSSVVKFTTTRESSASLNFNVANTREVTTWLVVSAMGRDKSLKMALRDTTLMPVGGVAAQLQKVSEGRYQVINIDGGGLLFCFLPLPIQTSFPVHVNGFFAIHSSRMLLYESSSRDKTDTRGLWNEALLDDAITHAYCILLEDLTQLCPESDSYAVWPSHSILKEAGFLGRLTEAVYQHVCCLYDNLEVVKAAEDWTSMSQSRMLSRQFRNQNIGDVALSALRTILADDNDVYAVDIPDKIVQTILQTSCRSFIEERTVNEVEFYTAYFLPKITSINPSERDQLIFYALRDEEISGHLDGVSCIPVATPDGTRLRPIKELIHPNSQLTALFDKKEERFPAWDNCEGKILDILVKLGMRKDSLPWREIVQRCAVIASNPETSGIRTPIILSLIEKQIKPKSEKTNSEDTALGKIRQIKFLPVMKKPKPFPLQWRGNDYSETQLISCEEGFLKSEMNLVSCSRPIIDEKLSFNNVHFETKQKLGLLKAEIDPSVVVTQVQEVVEVCTKTTESKNFSADDFRILNEVYDAAFKWLDNFLKGGERGKSTVKQLASFKCIMLQTEKHINYFLDPERCAIEFPLGSNSLLPYIAAVSPTMARSYPVLLKAIGVRQTFSIVDYVGILNEIKEESDNGCLNERQLGVAIYLVTRCVYEEVKFSAKEHIDLLQRTPIPNAEGSMRFAKDLCFNNCLWLAGASERSKFCHELISHEIASALGLQTIRQGVLKNHRIGIPFGQKERLVKRIKRILEGYPFSEDILKEMLQNADDSGATEIQFISDSRTLPTQKIFEESWKPLQGPALCVFNNKSFKSSDLEGIQQLGEGGKSGDLTKTGQYGVGFNCVYHVTDVPTFLTTVDEHGTVLCAFDPNCKYVPNAQISDPGALYNDVETLKNRFPDVFKGYLLNHEMFDVSRAGTFFRFPLRNTDIAKESEISQKVVSLLDIKDMFVKFKTDMAEAMLFVNSIEKMSLVEVCEDKDGTEIIKIVYHVSVNMTDEARKKRREFHKYVVETAAKLAKKNLSLRDVAEKEVSYQMTIRDSENNEDVWQIVQRFGFEDPNTIPEEIVQAVKEGDLGLLPRGGVAYLVKTSRKEARKNRLFCFLPLPVQVELPVQVNGHFFLDHENRRDLWKDEKKTYRAEWNRCLMERTVAPAYASLLCMMRDRIKEMESFDDAKREMEKYFNAFPKVEKNDLSYVNLMSKCLYAYITAKKLEILPVQCSRKSIKAVEWRNPCNDSHKVFFDMLESQMPELTVVEMFRSSGVIRQEVTNPPKEKKSSVVRKVLQRCGFNMFSCPVRIFKWFEKSGIKVSAVSPEAVLDFFGTCTKRPTMCKVVNLPEKITDTPYKDVASLAALLEYISMLPNYKTRLEGMPFLLTIDEYVRTFEGRMPRFASKYCEIAPHIPHMFIHWNILDKLRLNSTSDPQLCSEFTVEEFAKVLPDLISVPEFYNSDDCYPVESLEIFLAPYKIATHHWLTTIWYFLQSFLIGKSPEHDKVIISGLLKSLNNCSLLPVLVEGREMLYPLCRSLGVIPLQSITDMLNRDIATILHKLGVAQPNYKYLSTTTITQETFRLLNCILGGVQQPTSVVEALKILLTKKPLERKLTNSEGLRLLSYLSSNIDCLKSAQDTKKTLRMLPFFITPYDKQTSLEGGQVYILKSEIPSIDLETLGKQKNLVFLKTEFSIKPLLEHLGCEFILVENTYSTLIFEHFDCLTCKGQEVHMEFIRNHIVKLKSLAIQENTAEVERLLLRIRSLAFIPKNGLNGAFPPTEFYDPENKVFQMMQENDKFPPKPYNDWKWLSLLRLCGLVKDVTEEMFLSYATQVERNADGDGDWDLLRKQSETLCRHLLTEMKPSSEKFLKTVKQIKFVAPEYVEERLEQLHIQYGVRALSNLLLFHAFQEAVCHRHHKLSWTVRSLLPNWIDELEVTRKDKATKLLKELGATLNPELSSVALHAKKLCESFKNYSIDEKKARAPALKEVLKSIYEFLGNVTSLGETEKSILTRSPCVFIEETFSLVRPTQLALDIKSIEEIKPYLYKFPLELGNFADLFRTLGATKELTTAQFTIVLADIADGCQGEKLNPEDRRASLKAMKGLFSLIDKDPKIDGNVYLLCQDEKLHPSSDVVFSDNISILERISQFTEPVLIDANLIGLTHHEVELALKKLPQGRQTKFVSEIVREVVTDAENVPCSFAEKMAARLRNPVFRSGFERIVRHCLMAHKNSGKIFDVDKRCVELISGLNRIEFVGKYHVLTHLTYRGQKIESSEKQRDYFEEVLNLDGLISWKFYIRYSADISDNDFSESLANAINKMTMDQLSHCLMPLSGILHRPLSDIDSYLHRHCIKEIGASHTSSGYKLGVRIPADSLHLLIQDEFVFYCGQMVALELDDPFDRDEPGLATFCLVQVIERLESDDPSAPRLSTRYRVKVDEEGEEKIVNATELYAFSRARGSSNTSQTAIVVYVSREESGREHSPQQDRPTANPEGETNFRDSPQQENEEGETNFRHMTLEEIVEEIKTILKEAWKRPLEERKKVRKRLYLKWHPDKNPNRIELCTEVCKILQHLICLLDKGISIDDYKVSRDDANASSSRARTGSTSSYDFTDFDDFFDRMRQRARFYNRQEQHYSRNSSKRGSSGFYHARNDYDQFFRGFAHQPNPQPQEGRRWMRQAKHSLQSAVNDAATGSYPSFDWMCLKCYEASKTAIRAVQLSIDSNKTGNLTDKLTSFCFGLNDSTIGRLCRELENLVASESHLKYPSSYCFPQIPKDMYSEEKASEVFRISSEILNRCSELIDTSNADNFFD